ncbi:MAG: hypothetical protein L0Y70_11135 [Gemmataceae bacterium]|nr:hypothetical protein [Gemmataceae bacterium]
MANVLSEAGSASLEQRQQAITEWLRAALAAGIVTATFPADGSLEERLAGPEAKV